METISFKLQENVLRKIDHILKPLHFNNRTEFIREAVREKLNKIETEHFMRKLEPFKGSSKISLSDKQLEKIREDVSQNYAKELGVKLD